MADRNNSSIECGLTVQLTDGLTPSRPRCRYDKENHKMAHYGI